MTEETKIHLTQFLDYLLKEGYCDTDVYCEPPTAIDGYMSKYNKDSLILDSGDKVKQGECERCSGTGCDGYDRCDPPNPYICEDCNGTGKSTPTPPSEGNGDSTDKPPLSVDNTMGAQERYEKALAYREPFQLGSYPAFAIKESEYHTKLRIAAGLPPNPPKKEGGGWGE